MTFNIFQAWVFHIQVKAWAHSITDSTFSPWGIFKLPVLSCYRLKSQAIPTFFFPKVINPRTSPFLDIIMINSSLDTFHIFMVNHDFEYQTAHTQLSNSKWWRGRFLTLLNIWKHIQSDQKKFTLFLNTVWICVFTGVKCITAPAHGLIHMSDRSKTRSAHFNTHNRNQQITK
jgi:hypothetical protein